MAKVKSLINDPRWPEFRDKFAFNLSRFQVEVCGYEPTWQQFMVNREIQRTGCRVSIASGHGTGKSRTAAGTAWWHLTCYARSNMMFTAPKIEQVRNVIWKEIADIKEYVKGGRYAWIADYVIIEAERVYIKNCKSNWYVIAKTAPKGSPENMAGMHRKWLLIWADEASGIPDANYKVMTGALTDDRNRMVMTSQPTRDTGFFYETHHSLSIYNGGRWTSITLSSEESPLVGEEAIREKIAEYGGRDTIEYKIRMLGIFPEKTDKYLTTRTAIDACIFKGHESNRRIIDPGEHYGIIITVDVGAGEYRDYSVISVARVIGYGDNVSDGEKPRRIEVFDIPLYSNTRDVEFLIGMVVNVYAQYENATLLVDAGGMGIPVCQALVKAGLPVIRVNWGKPCWNTQRAERFYNRRAQANVSISRAVKDGRFAVVGDAVRHRERILAQGSRIPYTFNEKAQHVIMPKPQMAEEGIKSPDIWDTFAFFYLDEAHYTVCEVKDDAGEEVAGAIDDAHTRLLAALAAQQEAHNEE